MPPKTGLHPRNRHKGHYDFAALIELKPELVDFVTTTRQGEKSIDFSDPEAVRALNGALLQQYYGVEHWEIPKGYLCPPIPGRSDYIHHMADLLAAGGEIPRGPSVRVLDIGVGASCIYPIIGHREYGWQFVGADIDPAALSSAGKIVASNAVLRGGVELRLQESPSSIFHGVVKPGETFDLVICNPPFHASEEEAQEGSRRKWKNLGLARTSKRASRDAEPRKNFGGQASELWCTGGEIEFVRRMIEESVELGDRVRWFTTLVSKEANLMKVAFALKKSGVAESRTVEMAQGQKRSRVVGWRFG